MKKHTSASNDDDVERCYCQAANAAAAALDLQAQLFDKLKDGCSLQPPPVVVFTCIGPVVKVWLAYQDESRIFRNPMQVGAPTHHSELTLTLSAAHGLYLVHFSTADMGGCFNACHYQEHAYMVLTSFKAKTASCYRTSL
jgi:hypothetical protein